MSSRITIPVVAGQGSASGPELEAYLTGLVLDSVTSVHSRRSYRTGLEAFFRWLGQARPAGLFEGGGWGVPDPPPRTGAFFLHHQPAPGTRPPPRPRDGRQRLPRLPKSPPRSRAFPGSPATAPGLGNWLTREQANDLLNAPDPGTLIGKRDRALLALLVGCGLRRSELVQLYIEHLQQRDARWVIPDLAGKGGRVRTVTVPAGVKTRIDLWTSAVGISEGPLFWPVTKGGEVQGRAFGDEKAIWRLVVRYARVTELGKLAPHDLRRTCASCAARRAGTWSRSSSCSAMPRGKLPNATWGRSRTSPRR